jgi:hypothetical protein
MKFIYASFILDPEIEKKRKRKACRKSCQVNDK